MKINYFFRHQDVGFSIQRVSRVYILHLSKKIATTEIYMPRRNAGIADLLINGLYSFLKKSSINHITGEVHYLLYFLNKKNTIITVHDIMYYSYLKGLKKKVWKFIYINSLKRANTIVFISNFAKEQVTNILDLPENRIKVIPNAVSEGFEFSPKEFNIKKPIILHIGTLERKNLIRTIKALNGICCHLRIIGKISDDTVNILLENNVEYSNGFNLSDDEIIKEYENCDIVNFPSLFEGFGMPILEGQKVGRVVVTSNISPMNEISGGGAALVNPTDIDSISDMYKKVISNEIFRESLIAKGNENVSKFSVENICEQYLNIYKKITNS
jgi:glycosyltransferase involved in cell wall biosynthesis